MEGAVVVGRLLDHAKGNAFSTYGLNAATGEYVDMVCILDNTEKTVCVMFTVAKTSY